MHFFLTLKSDACFALGYKIRSIDWSASDFEKYFDGLKHLILKSYLIESLRIF